MQRLVDQDRRGARRRRRGIRRTPASRGRRRSFRRAGCPASRTDTPAVPRRRRPRRLIERQTHTRYCPMRLVLLEKSVEAQRILHLGGGQFQQFGKLDHRLRRHVAQPLVDQMQRRQRGRLLGRIARKADPRSAFRKSASRTVRSCSRLHLISSFIPHPSLSYRSNSAAMMFKLPSTATTSLRVWPRIRCGKRRSG